MGPEKRNLLSPTTRTVETDAESAPNVHIIQTKKPQIPILEPHHNIQQSCKTPHLKAKTPHPAAHASKFWPQRVMSWHQEHVLASQTRQGINNCCLFTYHRREVQQSRHFRSARVHVESHAQALRRLWESSSSRVAVTRQEGDSEIRSTLTQKSQPPGYPASILVPRRSKCPSKNRSATKNMMLYGNSPCNRCAWNGLVDGCWHLPETPQLLPKGPAMCGRRGSSNVGFPVLGRWLLDTLRALEAASQEAKIGRPQTGDHEVSIEKDSHRCS